MTWSEKRLLEIGPVLRYAREKTDDPVVDGLPNYHFLVRSQGTSRALLESGINPIAKVKASSGLRVPAILISSSPHKVGSRETPWQDTFAPDVGHIRYFGDNKSPDSDPGTKKGNRALIHQFELHHRVMRLPEPPPLRSSSSAGSARVTSNFRALASLITSSL